MKKSKKKVLFLITKSNWGGAQRYVYDLAVGLPKGEYDVVVAVGGNGALVEKLHQSHICTISIPSLQRDVSITKELKTFSEINSILKIERPDIFHINSSKAGALGALAGRLYKVPRVIFTAHGWAFNEDRPWWQKIILKKIYWLTILLSHHTIAVSHEVKRQMNWPWIKNKISVVHNGRTIHNLCSREDAREYLCEKEPRLKNYRDDFWSITIAELHPIKRHDAVIEVMKDVVEKEPNTRHIIIGGGESLVQLETLIKKNNLEEHVFLLGPIDEASQYLKAADLFILASRSEAMAYVVIEASIAGLPIIATAVGGLPEIINHQQNGLLVPPLDNIALFKAILQIRTDEVLREKLSRVSLERAQDFTFTKTLEKTTDLYSN